MTNQARVTFIGRVGKDPELRYSKDHLPLCHIAVAENIFGTEITKWHQVKVFGKEAENCKLYLKKGSLVFINGRADLKSYVNKDGIKKEFTEIVADKVGFSSL